MVGGGGGGTPLLDHSGLGSCHPPQTGGYLATGRTIPVPLLEGLVSLVLVWERRLC